MTNIQKKNISRKESPAPSASCASLCNKAFLYFSLVAIVISVLVVSPVQTAGTKYMAGSPELSAYISGTNEVSPGDTVTLKIVIENKGVNEFKFIQSGVIDRDDLPNTAKFLTVSLASGDVPVTIKSDPQMLGDLKGSSTTSCVINMKVNADAAAGSYTLPLILKYTYLYEAEQYGTDTIQYYYREKNETFSLPIKIKPKLKISVLSAEAEHLNAGTEGYITLTVKNTGHENGKNTIIKIVRNDNSPIVPTTSSVYIGDFSVNQTITSRFKVSISSDAEDQTYPLDVLVNYENIEGDQVTSDVETIGMQVGKKIIFSISSAPNEVFPGQKKVIIVQYLNSGGAPAYNVQARISAVDPFTSNDDTAFLGTLTPGEIREAVFEISVDKSATIKEYALDSEIRYRDALDNTLISDPLKVRVQVSADKGIIANIFSNPLALGIIVIVIIGIGFFVYRWRREA
ncbi:MAG: S-layer protein [Methanoregula sp.]|nr:S-layer protein [Methanoregula sp.]